ncbi:hypothetical protein [Schumannella sp. 10F1B-5-1]|uniref:hypothetical protein n=1 Tax=Schumannella sp. 10F1B-5-1 TaxID=2590780 RepID=UPI00113067B3|nr:hypothetical protein [Schumannella sp. 10F1B-5-1]TPW72306.1 hypothetical protein FJ658_08540 [Schumannella sp. 10F1B-5-1]
MAALAVLLWGSLAFATWQGRNPDFDCQQSLSVPDDTIPEGASGHWSPWPPIGRTCSYPREAGGTIEVPPEPSLTVVFSAALGSSVLAVALAATSLAMGRRSRGVAARADRLS